ncbi:hypothetical protein J2T59_001169 [Methanosalsum natronophilum]|nr:hypothetical protein [Methanosalsum natronophilum]
MRKIWGFKILENERNSYDDVITVLKFFICFAAGFYILTSII